MIDDIVGGADFVLAKKGLSKKACIYGGSYGGFASASAVFAIPSILNARQDMSECMTCQKRCHDGRHTREQIRR